MVELSPIQKKAIDLFRKSPLREKFYFTGGTALAAVYLHHRRSDDLDFFSEQPFSPEETAEFCQSLIKPLGLKKITRNKIYDRWEFFLENKEKIKLEFVFYEHKSLKTKKKWRGIKVDAIEDMAANKVMALFDRNDPKDLVDLYFLLKKKRYKVGTLLKWAEQKFGFKVEPSTFWSETFKSFSQLNKIKPLLITYKNQKIEEEIITEIRDYFKKKSTSYLHRIID